VEQTSHGVRPETLRASSPVCLVLGSKANGVDQAILDMADIAITIPMLGMANSLNVASAATIVLHRLSALLPMQDDRATGG
jgi:tRNA (guanosine-2'-O-)-methyltransferase